MLFIFFYLTFECLFKFVVDIELESGCNSNHSQLLENFCFDFKYFLWFIYSENRYLNARPCLNCYYKNLSHLPLPLCPIPYHCNSHPVPYNEAFLISRLLSLNKMPTSQSWSPICPSLSRTVSHSSIQTTLSHPHQPVPHPYHWLTLITLSHPYHSVPTLPPVVQYLIVTLSRRVPWSHSSQPALLFPPCPTLTILSPLPLTSPCPTPHPIPIPRFPRAQLPKWNSLRPKHLDSFLQANRTIKVKLRESHLVQSLFDWIAAGSGLSFVNDSSDSSGSKGCGNLIK